LPSIFLAGDIFELIRDRKVIGDYRIARCCSEPITDEYYGFAEDADSLDTEEMPAVCYRRRTTKWGTSFERKRTIAAKSDYLRYACESLEGPLAGYLPIATIRNCRVTLELQHAQSTKAEAWLHLDDFSVEPPAELPDFDANDITDARKLWENLRNPRDAVSAFISDKIAPGDMKSLDACADKGEWESLKSNLAEALNRIIREGSFNSGGAFKDVDISAEAWLMLAEDLGAESVVYQNRRLLEDAFPKHIRKRKAAVFREIEIVGGKPQVLMDIAEVLANSFNLVQVQSAKIQRVLPGIISRGSKQKLWLDADTGVDDAMAMLLSFRSPERCEVLAVSAVGGNVSVDKVMINSAKMVHYADVQPTPLLFSGLAPKGAPGDASNVHGAEGIGNINRFLTSFRPPEPQELVSGFQRVIDSLPQKEVTFVATGPLTNVAHLISTCPDAVRKLKHIIIMGGAFNEPGNREALPEFNVFTDPESARRVLDFCRQNEIKHTFVPLDATHRVVLKSDRVQELKREGFKSADFIASLTEHYMDFYDRNQAMAGCPMHDPMAVGFALWPEFFISDYFHVEIAPSNSGPFSGATSADIRPTRLFRDRSKEVTGIVLRVDRERFLQKIEEKLLRR